MTRIGLICVTGFKANNLVKQWLKGIFFIQFAPGSKV